MSLGLEKFDDRAEHDGAQNAGYLAGLHFIKAGETREHTFQGEQAELWQQGFNKAKQEHDAAVQMRRPEPDQAGRLEE